MKSTIISFFITLFMISFSSLQADAINAAHCDEFLYACSRTLNFTQPRTIHYFLHDVFSDKKYAFDYLPYNVGTHMAQFLEHGKKVGYKSVYMESTFRLFYNKLKACPYVCPTSFSDMLSKVPHLLEGYCSRTADGSFFVGIEKNMVDIFVPRFVSEYSFFKSNPEEFLNKLSHDVTVMIENAFDVHDHIAREQLKQMFVRFLEMGLMKLVWDPAEQHEIWDSVKTISGQLSDTMDMGLITADELDDCYKSLLESFCRFLDLTGSDLSRDLIEDIKEDVCSDTMLMFELEEQQDYIETKRERMLGALLETEAKIEARMRGIVTDVIAC